MKYLPLLLVVLLAGFTRAQTDSHSMKQILGSARVIGFIGGESHDRYLIHLQKGQKLIVQLVWKLENNTADFTLSKSGNFENATPVQFGVFSTQPTRWVGVIPQSANYFLYVTAYPTAEYTLWVKVE